MRSLPGRTHDSHRENENQHNTRRHQINVTGFAKEESLFFIDASVPPSWSERLRRGAPTASDKAETGNQGHDQKQA